MIVMEKEVREKFCVFSYAGAIAEGASPDCIGAKCMQWRWWRFSTDVCKEDRQGYCGVSGEPQGGS